MIIDKELQLATTAPVFATDDIVYIEDVAGGNDIITTNTDFRSHPDQLWLKVTVSTAFAGGTSAQFNLITDSALPMDDSSVVLLSSGAIVVADLAAGATAWLVKLPVTGINTYLSLSVTNVGANSAGAIDASIVKNVTDNDFSA